MSREITSSPRSLLSIDGLTQRRTTRNLVGRKLFKQTEKYFFSNFGDLFVANIIGILNLIVVWRLPRMRSAI